MTNTQVCLVAMFFGGVACLGVAAVLTLVGWRADAPPMYYYGLGSDLTAHPDRYVRSPFATFVRVFTLMGSLLFCVASLGMAALSIQKWLW